MPLLTPALRQRLARMRLVAGDAFAQSGIGERRSRAKGEGIEFEDHRAYQVGDDMRRLDPHLYARLGEPYVRQYNVSAQLPISLLLDTSASMGFGEPSKHDFATAMTVGLALAAVAGSDTVQCGVLRGGDVLWHATVGSVARLGLLENWLASIRPSGPTDLAEGVSVAHSQLPPNGLTVLISDFWSEDVTAAIDELAAARQSMVVLQVLSPEELEPRTIGSGAVRLADSETGSEIEVNLGAEEYAKYGVLLDKWTEELRERVLRYRGRFLRTSSATRLDEMFLRHLPLADVIR